ncbi:MAG: undecaprenyldiphospho-muramoylpentapeptide beta-N-acetylglucosaminyltransferase [Gammaproteobacteria bacterium]|nr:undecaprenyldiphospho-muramoylpentapeptide beta-N-acetylglucosaminyltransferase [Gammaproteobacteria bacterium]
MNRKVLIMAAGTGGHVFPAFSIAKKLKAQSITVEWLGTPRGMENKLLAETKIPLHCVSVKGLRGSGIMRKLLAPIMLFVALIQSIIVILKVNPDCVLGMGGFVSGPAGVAAKLLGKPLLIHEQNAVAGLTNRLLASRANKVFEAFPGTFDDKINAIFSGNPLRAEILKVREKRDYADREEIRLLVLGGSQGSAAINRVIPELIINWTRSERLLVSHQTGDNLFSETVNRYEKFNVLDNKKHRLEPFFSNMEKVYDWADFIICRSGASTISEISAIGLPSILIPYPYHSDNQQNLNAKWLVDERAAILIPQHELDVKRLLKVFCELLSDKERLNAMSSNARSASIRDASEIIAKHCIEACYD